MLPEEANVDKIPARLGNGKIANREVSAEIARLNRNCFGRILSDYIGCAPDEESVRAFAKRFPDRYFAAMQMLAQMAGYQRDVNITNNVVVTHTLSDSDLHARLAAAEQRLLQANEAVRIKPPNEMVSRETLRTIEQDDKVIDME